MSETKTPWTPGPWVIGDDLPLPYGCKPRIYGCDKLIAEVGNALCEDQQEWEDNARLIAAAPRLYEALYKIVNSDMAAFAEDEGRVVQELVEARAAFAAARNEGGE